MREPKPTRTVSERELRNLLRDWQHDAPGANYLNLAERFRLLILNGQLPLDAVLPAERRLATLTGVSRTTATAAYRWLRDNGFAVARQGSGTWTCLPSSTPAPLKNAWPSMQHPLFGDEDGLGDWATASSDAPPQVYEAYQHALTELPRYLPGHGYVSSGIQELREAIAQRYCERGLATAPDQIAIAHGALHALSLVLQVLGQEPLRVLVEDPTYPSAIDTLKAHQARLFPLYLDGNWPMESLPRLIAQTRANAAYLIPDFHNPTGLLMPHADRVEWVRLAQHHGMTLIIDECMTELDLRPHLPGQSEPTMPPSLGVIDTSGQHVVLLGSLSKVVWGGLRVGWVRASRSFLDRLERVRSAHDLGGAIVDQLTARHLIMQLESIRDYRRTENNQRCSALIESFAEHLPDWQVLRPQGGIVCWAQLPEGLSSSAIVSQAAHHGIRLVAGSRFVATGRAEHRLRLPFARPLPDYSRFAEQLARIL